MINGWGNLLPLIFRSVSLLIYKLHNNRNNKTRRGTITFVFLASAALMNLEDHLTDEVEEKEDTEDPSQPPWHISFTKVHPNEDVRD